MKSEFEKQNQNTNIESIWLEKGGEWGGVSDCELWVMFRLALFLPRLAFLPFLGHFLSCKDTEKVLLQFPNVCANYRKEKGSTLYSLACKRENIYIMW